MSELLRRVQSGDILISDGATGTHLQANGLEPGGCPEEFNLTRPDVIRQMAAGYFDIYPKDEMIAKVEAMLD